MRVRVYRNLHKECFSIQHHTKGVGWRLLHHKKKLYLEDCKFIVQKGGRNRVLKEKQKNVHAYIEGNYFDEPQEGSVYVSPYYNPYEFEHFVTFDDRRKLEKGENVYLDILL